VAVTVGEHGQSIAFLNPARKRFDVSASSLRALLDESYRSVAAKEDDAERQELGAQFRALRERHGLTQEELSTRSGIPQESLSRLERGKRDPRFGTLQKLAKGFGLSLEDLLGELRGE
jgi:DNA-binding XRE family transcriptional regulator